MKFEDFTAEQREVIAEFVYSYYQDIMIKSDAEKLVQVFTVKDMIDKQHATELNEKIKNNEMVLEELIEILFTSVEEAEGKKIMNEYFGREID
jgi:hypothetical protein